MSPIKKINLGKLSLLLCIPTLVWVGCSSETPLANAEKPFAGRMGNLYDYNNRSALVIERSPVRDTLGIQLQRLTYDSPKGGKVTAYLLIPPKADTATGAVVYMGGATLNRDNLLNEGRELTMQCGSYTLLIDPPYTKTSPRNLHFNNFANPNADRALFVKGVVDAQRGIDLLLQNKAIDSSRIGMVGFYEGADMVGVISGIDKRVVSFVLVGAAPNPSKFIASSQNSYYKSQRLKLTADQVRGYVKVMENTDPIDYVRYASPSALMFQFATNDDLVSETEANRLTEAASEPKIVTWYGTSRTDLCQNEEAKKNRLSWLQIQLKLKPAAFK